MKPLRLSVIAVALVLAGCTASPTDAPRDQATPSFNEGGNTTGSGSSEGDGVTEEGGTPVGTTAPTDSTTTGRGGNGLGSGN